MTVYRSRESHFGRTKQARAAQLRNLKPGGKKSAAPIFPQPGAADPKEDPFNECYKDDPVRFIEDFCFLTPERRLCVLDPWQKDVLNALFERDLVTARRRFTMGIVSAPKKTGKTSLAAFIIEWQLFQGPADGEIILAANSEAQSTYVVFSKLCKSLRMNKYALQHIDIKTDSIENLSTGTVVRVVAMNARTIAGLSPTLVLFDELHSYRDTDSNNARDFFDELVIPPTREGLCLITSYASTSEDCLLYELYQRGMEGTDPRLYFFWSHDPLLSPRTSPEYLEDQRKKLHPNTYARLFENSWTHGEKEFVSMDEYGRCVDPAHAPMFEDPQRVNRVFLGIDIGVKSDCSAVVAVGKQGDKVALIQHRVWRPGPNDPVDIRDVEKYILELSQKFNIVEAHFDPSQFLEGSTRLTEAGINMVQFTQAQGVLISMAQNLYQLIKSGTLKLYQANDLKKHVQNASIKESAKGFQIVKAAPSKKIDLCISLAMCCHACCKQPINEGGAVYLGDVSPWRGDDRPSLPASYFGKKDPKSITMSDLDR